MASCSPVGGEAQMEGKTTGCGLVLNVDSHCEDGPHYQLVRARVVIPEFLLPYKGIVTGAPSGSKGSVIWA